MSRLSNALVRGLAIGLIGGAAIAQTNDSPSAASIKNLQAGREAAKDTPPAPGKDVKDLASAPKTGAAPKDTAVTTAVPQRRRPVLRCWQEGRLVFEGAGVLPSSQGQAAIELRGANGTALQVFDLRNGLCLLDYGSD